MFIEIEDYFGNTLLLAKTEQKNYTKFQDLLGFVLAGVEASESGNVVRYQSTEKDLTALQLCTFVNVFNEQHCEKFELINEFPY